VNGSGDQNGLFDSLIRFPMSNVVASLDNALGEHDWVVTQARLVLTEIAVPDNAIFNRGVVRSRFAGSPRTVGPKERENR